MPPKLTRQQERQELANERVRRLLDYCMSLARLVHEVLLDVAAAFPPPNQDGCHRGGRGGRDSGHGRGRGISLVPATYSNDDEEEEVPTSTYRSDDGQPPGGGGGRRRLTGKRSSTTSDKDVNKKKKGPMSSFCVPLSSDGGPPRGGPPSSASLAV